MNSIFGFVSLENGLDFEEIMSRMSASEKFAANAEQCNECGVFQEHGHVIGVGFNYIKGKTTARDVSSFANDDYVSVFHGIIYNKSQIAKELYVNEPNIANRSDAKIVLNAFEKWGSECAHRLNGRFAFVIISKKDHSIFVSRDRLGKVRLYYYHNDSLFVFSTRIESVMNFPGIDKKINTDILGYMLRLGYVPTPYSIYNDVFKLEAGTSLLIKGSKLIKSIYWRPRDVLNLQKSFSGSYVSAIANLEQVLLGAVRLRLEGTKNVGALLSSGIDSSLIAAMVQKELGGGLTTFTIGMKDKRYNEAELAIQIAKHLGTRHKEYYISENDLLKCVDRIASLIDEPFGDSGLIPMMVVSQIASGEVDTAFGGDGGDELFEGYPHYRFVRQAQAFDWVGGLLSCMMPESVANRLPHKMQHVILNRNRAIKSQLVIPSELEVYKNVFRFPIRPPYYEIEVSMNIRNWELRRQVLDMEKSFCDDAIQKSDLATRFGNLDLRSPLIDYHVAELSLSLPTSFKSRGAVNKRILRDLAYKYVSKGLLDLPKRGFCIPIDDWMKSALSEEVRELSSDSFIAKQGIFNGEELRKAITENHTIKWNFYVFQKWFLNNF